MLISTTINIHSHTNFYNTDAVEVLCTASNFVCRIRFIWEVVRDKGSTHPEKLRSDTKKSPYSPNATLR